MGYFNNIPFLYKINGPIHRTIINLKKLVRHSVQKYKSNVENLLLDKLIPMWYNINVIKRDDKLVKNIEKEKRYV